MKEEKYYTIASSVLPPYFALVVEAKRRCEEGEAVSKVCRDLDISRSTYYKYKDYVFLSEKPKKCVKVEVAAESISDAIKRVEKYQDKIVLIKQKENGFLVVLKVDENEEIKVE